MTKPKRQISSRRIANLEKKLSMGEEQLHLNTIKECVEALGIKHVDENGIFRQSIKNGNFPLFKIYLDLGLKPELEDFEWASDGKKGDRLKIFHYMLNNFPDVDLSGSKERSFISLRYASAHLEPERFDFIFNRHFNEENNDLLSDMHLCLVFAIQTDNIALVKHIFEHYIEPNSPNSVGNYQLPEKIRDKILKSRALKSLCYFLSRESIEPSIDLTRVIKKSHRLERYTLIADAIGVNNAGQVLLRAANYEKKEIFLSLLKRGVKPSNLNNEDSAFVVSYYMSLLGIKNPMDFLGHQKEDDYWSKAVMRGFNYSVG